MQRARGFLRTRADRRAARVPVAQRAVTRARETITGAVSACTSRAANVAVRAVVSTEAQRTGSVDRRHAEIGIDTDAKVPCHTRSVAAEATIAGAIATKGAEATCPPIFASAEPCSLQTVGAGSVRAARRAGPTTRRSEVRRQTCRTSGIGRLCGISAESRVTQAGAIA